MIGLVLYFFASFGLAYIVGHSVISEPVRTFIGGPVDKPRDYLGLVIALLECPACFGTWTGAIVGALSPGLFGFDTWWAGMLVGACATAGVNFILAKQTGLMPSEPDPMRELVGKMIEQQLRPQIRWKEDGPGVHATNMSAVAELGRAVMDEEETRVMRSLAERGLVVLNLAAVRDVLEPLQEVAAESDTFGARAIDALEKFDAIHPNVIPETDPRDINGHHVEGFLHDDTVRAAQEAEIARLHQPEDTPENWIRYREAQDFAEKMANERIALIESAHKAGTFVGLDQKERAADYNLRAARERAGALRPKDPMTATNTDALHDAPMPEGTLIPEDIAAFQKATADLMKEESIQAAHEKAALEALEEEF